MRRNRVSTACDRCRRQKQRCDDFRPCSNCVHARTPHNCSNGPSDPLSEAELEQPLKRQRTMSNHHSEPSQTAQSPGGHQTRDSLHRSASLLSQQRPERHAHNSYSSADHDSWPAERTPSRTGPPEVATLHAESAIDMTRRLFRDGSPSSPFSSRATFAIPGGESEHQGRTSDVRISVQELVGTDLPDQALCNSLLDTYFATVHWFSLVVLEPKFRARCNTVLSAGLVYRSDRAFIILLLMVLVMGCWYDASPELASLQNSFLRVVRSHFMDIIDEDSLEFVQVSALLGSFYLYHGRPRSSFSILGAATKTSQAIGLHREPDGRMDFSVAEERKRVWWTIYTWDRFATIIYGRPLGINDKDCNVSMPAEIYENMFSEPSESNEAICLSTYQTQLNHIYRIASPVLENIYGIRSSTDLGLLSRLPDMITNAASSLEEWKKALPAQLSYDLIADITDETSTKDKLHALQALSLQLTYDNIMIVLHRTLLADQRQIPSQQHTTTTTPPSFSPFSSPPTNPSDQNFARCLAAALSISRTQQKPRLIALAQNTHLVSFLAMNLFTSSVVMSICALSDTMSDIAQEAKRGMSRTLHLLRKLSTRASLPMQCSTILEDLVGLILKKEKAAMLFGFEEGLGTGSSLLREDGAEGDHNYHHDRAGHTNDLHPTTTNQNETTLPPQNTRAAAAQATYRSRAGSYAHPQAQTIFDLQRIFEENSIPNNHNKPSQSNFPASSSSYQYATYQDGGVDNNNHNNHNQNQNSGLGFLGGSSSGGFGFGGGGGMNNTTANELGQFWLWNMEPFQEDL